jgi:hypothetical protein
MAANYVLLEKITVGAAGAASVTFSGIPQTGYTDLVIKTSTRNTNSVNLINYRLNFNGSSAITFSEQLLYGDGSNAGWAMPTGTGGTTYGFSTGASATANTFANNEYYIPNYTSSNNKSVSIDMAHENNGTTAYVGIDAVLWASTAAITSITLTPTTTSIGQYSTFYLYGVAKLATTPAIVPYATGGDTIMTDGTYWYHAFLSSGTFTPQKGISCDVLVVAGGGGGGNTGAGAGGGGAGGLYYSTGNSLSTAQTVTVGAGGAIATSGSNSVFGSLTAAVAGGRGSVSSNPGATGGSGGGGAASGNTAGLAGTSGQGFAGGTGTFSTNGGNGFVYYTGGGGGGAAAVGVNGGGGTTKTAGNGGAGVNTYSSWLSATGLGVSGYIAGGGGGALYIDTASATSDGIGSTGGAGGGGKGFAAQRATTLIQTGTAGTTNTGGGGGAGESGFGNGYAGGSGLVIVRYAV